jgi:hypothetical protein
MRQKRSAVRLAWLLSVALLLAAVVTGGLSSTERRSSCSVCGYLKQVETNQFFGFPYRVRTTIMLAGHPPPPTTAPAAHPHDWHRYSTYTARGPAGVYGRSVTCQPSMWDRRVSSERAASAKLLPAP